VVNAADFNPSARPVTGPARITRGLLAATLAIGSAAISHSAAGHHGPHWIVLVLALAISLPVCSALSSVRLSRIRLGAAVGFSQVVLHGLFALFPASGAASGVVVDSVGTGRGVHDHAVTVSAAAHTGTVAQVLPDAPMILAHALAAVFTFAVIRRGEVLLHALVSLMFLRPAFILFLRPVSLTGPRAIMAHDSFDTVILRDLWTGAGAQTLRGPPVLAS